MAKHFGRRGGKRARVQAARAVTTNERPRRYKGHGKKRRDPVPYGGAA